MTLGLRPPLLWPKWDVSHEKLWGRHLRIRTWNLNRPARQAASQNSNSVLLVDHSMDRMQTKEKQKFGLKEDSVTAQHSGCNQRQCDKPGRWRRRGCLSLPIRASECCLQSLHRVFSLGACGPDGEGLRQNTKKDLSAAGNGNGWEMGDLVRVKLHVAAQILINNIF